jgi:hypothetical protein
VLHIDTDELMYPGGAPHYSLQVRSRLKSLLQVSAQSAEGCAGLLCPAWRAAVLFWNMVGA